MMIAINFWWPPEITIKELPAMTWTIWSFKAITISTFGGEVVRFEFV